MTSDRLIGSSGRSQVAPVPAGHSLRRSTGRNYPCLTGHLIATDTLLGARRNGEIAADACFGAADTRLGARRNGEVAVTVTDCGTNCVQVQCCGTALQHCSASPRRSHSARSARPRQSAVLTSDEISLQSAWFSLQTAPTAAPLRVQQPDLAINIRQILLVPLSSNFDRHVQRLASRFQKYGLLLYPR
jgi:hypothetical protein